MLLNYLLMLRRFFFGRESAPRLGLWGHGVNCQADSPTSLRERWKRALLHQADWWFAYTNFTRDILAQERYPEERITVVQNAIDTSELCAHAREISAAEIHAYRGRLGLRGERVGVYCGSLYRRKRIDFLIAAAREIRVRIPDFELVVIGDGPEASLLREAAGQLPWIHLVGPKFGRDKALALRLGQVFLMPKSFGLSVLDAFVMGLPLLTTCDGQHGPEISYLRPDENGYITADSPLAYAAETVSLLQDQDRLARLRENCLLDASRYTIEAMADNFTQGVIGCLESHVWQRASQLEPVPDISGERQLTGSKP